MKSNKQPRTGTDSKHWLLMRGSSGFTISRNAERYFNSCHTLLRAVTVHPLALAITAILAVVSFTLIFIHLDSREWTRGWALMFVVLTSVLLLQLFIKFVHKLVKESSSMEKCMKRYSLCADFLGCARWINSVESVIRPDSSDLEGINNRSLDEHLL